MNIDDLKTFINKRPLLTMRGLSVESGISDGLLGKILRGDRKMTDNVREKLLPVLKKYGFDGNKTT